MSKQDHKEAADNPGATPGGVPEEGEEEEEEELEEDLWCPKCHTALARRAWNDGRYYCAVCRRGTKFPLHKAPKGASAGKPAKASRRPSTTSQASSSAASQNGTPAGGGGSRERPTAPPPASSRPQRNRKPRVQLSVGSDSDEDMEGPDEGKPGEAPGEAPAKQDEGGAAQGGKAKVVPKGGTGELVWVKYSNYPVWPAEVWSEEGQPNSVLRFKRHDAELIQFLGTHELAWVSNILGPFDTLFSQHAPKCKTVDLRNAVAEGVELYAKTHPQSVKLPEMFEVVAKQAAEAAAQGASPAPTPSSIPPQVGAVAAAKGRAKARARSTAKPKALSKGSKKRPLAEADSDSGKESAEWASAGEPESSTSAEPTAKRQRTQRQRKARVIQYDVDSELDELEVEEEVYRDPLQSIELVLGRREHEGVSQVLVKYQNKSYRHVEWLNESLVRTTQAGRMRVNKYDRKVEEDDDEEGEGDGEFFDPDFDTIEDIVDCREVQGTEREYLVKWRGLGFEQCTWETAADLQDDDAIKAYRKRANAPPPEKVPKPEPREALEKLPTFEEVGKDRELALMKHQREGVRWLARRWHLGLNSMLADEMGLGKTVQAIVAMHYIKTQLQCGPFLVVAPLSTLGHWIREIQEWTDLELLVYRGNGEARAVIREHAWRWRVSKGKGKVNGHLKFDVLLVDYTTVRMDSRYISALHWEALIVDEAQSIKNHESKLYEVLHNLKTEHRILLTGTPLQNNTMELWSLMSFLQPDQFGSLESFQQAYGNIESKEEAQALQTLVKPNMLRRVKTEVEINMPSKEETLMEVEMTVTQKKFYRALLERNREYLTTGSKSGNAPKLNNLAMQLRKCCNHVFMLDGVEDRFKRTQELDFDIGKMLESSAAKSQADAKPEGEGQGEANGEGKGAGEGEGQEGANKEKEPVTPSNPTPSLTGKGKGKRASILEPLLPEGMTTTTARLVYASGKMIFLHKLLVKLRRDKHRVLVFSQFRIMLDVLEAYFNSVKLPFERIDGNVGGHVRQQAIDRFMDPERDAFAFLLTTRAGGVGINLTIADVVVIFDSDWNPQNDVQAQSRCHRIGQKRDVKVYRLVTRGTYEEQLFERASRKMGLHRTLLGTMEGEGEGEGGNGDDGAGRPQGGGKLDGMTAEEVERMLRWGSAAVLQDNDDDARRFCEEDIEEMLNTKSRVLRYGGDDAGEDGGDGGGDGDGGEGDGGAGGKRAPSDALAKARFGMRGETGVNIDDPDFWNKMLPSTRPSEVLASKLLELKQLKQAASPYLKSMVQGFVEEVNIHAHEVIDGVLQGRNVQPEREGLLAVLADLRASDLLRPDALKRMDQLAEQVQRPRRKRKQLSANDRNAGASAAHHRDLDSPQHSDEVDAGEEYAAGDFSDDSYMESDSEGGPRRKRRDLKAAADADPSPSAPVAMHPGMVVGSVVVEGMEFDPHPYPHQGSAHHQGPAHHHAHYHAHHRKRQHQHQRLGGDQDVEDPGPEADEAEALLQCPAKNCRRGYKTRSAFATHVIKVHRLWEDDVVRMPPAAVEVPFLPLSSVQGKLRPMERPAPVRQDAPGQEADGRKPGLDVSKRAVVGRSVRPVAADGQDQGEGKGDGQGDGQGGANGGKAGQEEGQEEGGREEGDPPPAKDEPEKGSLKDERETEGAPAPAPVPAPVQSTPPLPHPSDARAVADNDRAASFAPFVRHPGQHNKSRQARSHAHFATSLSPHLPTTIVLFGARSAVARPMLRGLARPVPERLPRRPPKAEPGSKEDASASVKHEEEAEAVVVAAVVVPEAGDGKEGDVEMGAVEGGVKGEDGGEGSDASSSAVKPGAKGPEGDSQADEDMEDGSNEEGDEEGDEDDDEVGDDDDDDDDDDGRCLATFVPSKSSPFARPRNTDADFAELARLLLASEFQKVVGLVYRCMSECNVKWVTHITGNLGAFLRLTLMSKRARGIQYCTTLLKGVGLSDEEVRVALKNWEHIEKNMAGNEEPEAAPARPARLTNPPSLAAAPRAPSAPSAAPPAVAAVASQYHPRSVLGSALEPMDRMRHASQFVASPPHRMHAERSYPSHALHGSRQAPPLPSTSHHFVRDSGLRASSSQHHAHLLRVVGQSGLAVHQHPHVSQPYPSRPHSPLHILSHLQQSHHHQQQHQHQHRLQSQLPHNLSHSVHHNRAPPGLSAAPPLGLHGRSAFEALPHRPQGDLPGFSYPTHSSKSTFQERPSVPAPSWTASHRGLLDPLPSPAAFSSEPLGSGDRLPSLPNVQSDPLARFSRPSPPRDQNSRLPPLGELTDPPRGPVPWEATDPSLSRQYRHW